MTNNIKTDDGGLDRMPEAVAYLQQYKSKVYPQGKPGRPNGMLYVHQHSGFTWSFEIWHTKAAFNVSISTRPYVPVEESEADELQEEE